MHCVQARIVLLVPFSVTRTCCKIRLERAARDAGDLRTDAAEVLRLTAIVT